MRRSNITISISKIVNNHRPPLKQTGGFGGIKQKQMKQKIEICQDDFVYFDGGFGYKVKRTTEKAVLIVVNRGDHVPRLFDVWLPRNCFNIIRTKEHHDTREVYCKDLSRWAMQKIKGY